jgi:5-methylcytosine-specific restriction endonuclease McrA
MKFELEPDNRGQNDATLLDDLRRVASELGKDFVTKGEYNTRGRFCAATFQRRFESWGMAHEIAGLRRIYPYETTVDDLVADLREVAKSSGKATLTREDYLRLGKYSPGLIARRCGTWRRGLELAGITVSRLQHGRRRSSEDELFENLERMWETLGRQPRISDFQAPLSRFSYVAYTRRYGGFRKALEAFVASINDDADNQGARTTSETGADVRREPIDTVRHKTSRTVSWRVRFLVMRRDDFRCRICGTSPAVKPGTVLVIDHIVAWAEGGETIASNLQTLCEPCNGGKSDLSMSDRNA